jgi:hypothetical protein
VQVFLHVLLTGQRTGNQYCRPHGLRRSDRNPNTTISCCPLSLKWRAQATVPDQQLVSPRRPHGNKCVQQGGAIANSGRGWHCTAFHGVERWGGWFHLERSI